MNKFCASGLEAIAVGSYKVLNEGLNVVAAGGVETISQGQIPGVDPMVAEPWIQQHKPDYYMHMLQTAEVVYDRYGVSRESQDGYSLQSQQRTALAQSEGRFDQEIVPMESIKRVVDKETGAESFETVTLTQDEGNRPEHHTRRTSSRSSRSPVPMAASPPATPVNSRMGRLPSS